ncbi:4-hydroxy-2-oxoheptanedioate aldolase [Winogradskya consettensis]|uniref:2,4-dihydroxyhept-2-ene-1,7-dioic acid aldolase n=1 Tax=Winogradskya consettensis TaxID=113560 RepID=A0A919W198_9ACTN|nr:aldolase/citrate lyase family protein [Actinoplanes consettensis]GIM76303.1 2,4-dihydroxyhept-2-ene-1,7-dioic acid aldolase [Actinoplanes consettensis]
MPVRLTLPPSFAAVLAAAERAQAGMWVCSGSPLVAEICAGGGLDWLLIDMEHAPNGLESVVAQLQAVAAYPVTPVVRVPVNDPVIIKQVLDLGAQNLLVPMVGSAAEAVGALRAASYPPFGVRGVGSALGRAARWNRVPGYLDDAARTVSVVVQIESAAAVEQADAIAASGVHGILVGPSDLAASMGELGRQEHPDVVAAVEHCIAAGRRHGVPVGVNAFAPETAQRYLDAGVSFILVGADVTLLARGSEGLAERFAG